MKKIFPIHVEAEEERMREREYEGKRNAEKKEGEKTEVIFFYHVDGSPRAE